MEIKDRLKPLNNLIQICPVCGKVDVFDGDGHSCEEYLENSFREDNE